MKVSKSKIKQLVKECLKEFYGPSSNRIDIELVKTALRRVQFDKDLAAKLLRDKGIENPRNSQYYTSAADYLEKMSNEELRSMFASVREEEQPEPYDQETDQFAPGPRQRPEDWKKGEQQPPTPPVSEMGKKKPLQNVCHICKSPLDVGTICRPCHKKMKDDLRSELANWMQYKDQIPGNPYDDVSKTPLDTSE